MKKAKWLLCLLAVLLVGMLITATSLASDGASAETRGYDRADLEELIDSERYPASEYPWAVFVSSDGENFTFRSAHKIYAHNEDQLKSTEDGFKISALGSINSADMSKNGTVLLLQRADYAMKNGDMAAPLAVCFTSSKLNNGAKRWDATLNEGAGGWLTADNWTEEKESDGYHYTHVYDVGQWNLGGKSGHIIMDFGEYTFDMSRQSGINFLPLQNKTDVSTELTVTLYGGTLMNVRVTPFPASTGGSKTVTETSAKSRDINVELIGTTITLTENAAALATRSGNHETLQTPNLNLTLTDCTIDAGRVKNTYKLFVDSASTTNPGNMHVVFNGGTLCAWGTDLASLATLNSGDGSSDSISGSVDHRIHEAVTEYGTIPPSFTDFTEYPFAVFQNGTFVRSTQRWTANDYQGEKDPTLGALSSGAALKGTVVILMTGDYKTKVNYDYAYPNLIYLSSSDFTIDLGGNTLTLSGISMMSAEIKGAGTVQRALTVKNGTIVAESNVIAGQSNNNTATTSVGFDFTFDRVDFELKGGSVVGFGNVPLASTGVKHLFDVTLNDCTINTTTSNAVFSMAKTTNERLTTTVTLNNTTVSATTQDATLFTLPANNLYTFVDPTTEGEALVDHSADWKKYTVVKSGIAATTFAKTAPALDAGKWFDLATGNLVTSPVADGVVLSFDLDLLEGASIRVGKPTGMRFETTVGEGMFRYLEEAGYSPLVGTQIIPADLLAAGNTEKYLDLVSDLSAASAKDGAYTFFAAIAEILPQNYTRSFAACSYLSYTIGGSVIVVANAEDTTARSVYDVACAAFKDYTEGTAQYGVVKGFIDSVVTLDAACTLVPPAALGYTVPYEVSYAGGVLIIRENGVKVSTIVVDGVAYTRGFESVDGVITVNYNTPPVEE